MPIIFSCNSMEVNTFDSDLFLDQVDSNDHEISESNVLQRLDEPAVAWILTKHVDGS